MDSNQLSIQLHIGIQTFSICIDRKQEKQYRDAEKMINRKLQQYATQFPNQSTEAYMSMTLLDMGLTLTKENNVDEKLSELLKRVETAIEQ